MVSLPILKEVVGHHNPVPYYLTLSMFPMAKFEIAGGCIDHLVGVNVADLHVHDVDEFYFLISPNENGAAIKVTIENKTKIYTSPAVIFVPAGHKHKFTTTKAEIGSFCLGIFNYE